MSSCCKKTDTATSESCHCGTECKCCSGCKERGQCNCGDNCQCCSCCPGKDKASTCCKK